jgi:predicted RNase H-like nuclease (RuvC/YqgF family)
VNSIPAPRTAAANRARRLHTERNLDLLRTTLQKMQRERTPITFPAVARRSGLSRSFLYQNTDAKALMDTAQDAQGDHRRQTREHQDDQAQASWRERALNAEQALKAAYGEITTGRERVAILLGQIRDLQSEYTEDTVQRVVAESTNLKRRVRELTDDNRSLSDKLQAARTNSRFLDKRIADLEAQLLEIDSTGSHQPAH